MFSLFLICSLALDTPVPETVLSLAPVAEDSDVFLSLPLDLTIDQKGGIYVADAFAKTVFVWNKDGSYRGTIGKQGSGPGEFQFTGSNGPQAYLSAVGGKLYVFDGGKKTISSFDGRGAYLQSSPFLIKGGSGRAEYFKVTAKGDYLINTSTFMTDPPMMVVGLYNEQGEQIGEVSAREDKSWSSEGSSARPSAIIINAFSPQMIVHYDIHGDRILVGDTAKPAFDIHNADGKLIKNVSFKMVQQDVTEEDKAEFGEVRWIKNNSFFKPGYPAKKAFYTGMLPLADGTFLVFTESPFYRKADGLRIDENGRTLARFQYTCGETGGLFGADGRLFAVVSDEEGELTVKELRLP